MFEIFLLMKFAPLSLLVYTHDQMGNTSLSLWLIRWKQETGSRRKRSRPTGNDQLRIGGSWYQLNIEIPFNHTWFNKTRHILFIKGR